MATGGLKCTAESPQVVLVVAGGMVEAVAKVVVVLVTCEAPAWCTLGK